MSASQDLARRAVACKAWRWMPGMLGHAQPAGRFSSRVDDSMQGVHALKGTNALPDLEDPATLGCLLALVRKAWGCCLDIEEFYTNTGSHQFEVHCHTSSDGDPQTFRGGSLGSALVAALEAAP